MAKSIRSKAKRTFRSKKRESGVYAATEAARLHRLNAKLASVASADKEGDVPIQDLEGEANGMPGWCWYATLGLLDAEDITLESMDALTNGEQEWDGLRDRRSGFGGLKHQQDDALNDSTETMAVDAEPPKRISTHGPKGSRREEWRKSKGMVPKPKLGALNRQGVPAARRKAGRSKRRR